MSKLKPGTGEVTRHGDNKQNEHGAGSRPSPFEKSHGPNTAQNKVQGVAWKSKANPNPPNQAEIKNRAPSSPVTRPNEPGSDKNRVLQKEASPAGRNSSNSTYTAPRKEGSSDPMERGYTKP